MNRDRMKGSLLLAGLVLVSGAFLRAADSDDFFESKVRPVLMNNCSACHGDAAMSGLRVDSREALLKGGSRGPAIVPGDPDASLLIQSVRQSGDLKMPKGGKLQQQEIEALTAWIKSGASWPASKTAVKAPTGRVITAQDRAFWSFQPLKMPATPEVKDAGWSNNTIDKFILAKLQMEGMKPAPKADRRTLIRRVYYDLLGLPPTAEEVNAFVGDKSPDAYRKLVDKLLASPQYGERWGRHWMDVVRFGEDDNRGLADTGYEPYVNAYIYRDWVIKSVNDDMPFDLFLKAQLAGDQLDESIRAKALPGLGFFGQGPWYYDLADPPMARADERHERVDAITRSMLGLTVGCARCHDHKYDPITVKDYYAIAGIVNNTAYHEYPLVPKRAVDQWMAEDKRTKALEKMLKEFSEQAGAELAETLVFKTKQYMLAAWSVSGEAKKSVAEAAAENKLDQEVLERWVRFLAKPPLYYPYLKPWQAMIQSGGGTLEQATELAKNFQDLLIDVMNEKKETDERNKRIIAKGTPLDPKPSVILPNNFQSFFDEPQIELGKLTSERLSLWMDVFSKDLNELGNLDASHARPGLLAFRDYGLQRQLSPEWGAHLAALRDEIAARRKEMPEFPFVHGIMDVDDPKDIRIHVRGSPYNLGDPATRRFVEVLSDGEPKPFAKGSGRLELAESIAESPIAARVIANRVWKWHFGTGIVNTPSNFGKMGERPSHPELLEYLAKSFVDGGRSLKQINREILLSATYQMASTYDEASYKKDPADRLHWRGPRQRLEAEQIRDSLLAVSGELDSTPGGPPADLANVADRRRTVYGRISRFRLDTFLQVFDFPNPAISSEGRMETSVPLQRLYFMNSGFVNRQAEALAKRAASEAGDDNKIRKAYELVYQREPEQREVEAGVAFLKRERQNVQQDVSATVIQPAPVNAKIAQAAEPVVSDAPHLARPDPLVSLVRVLFSSEEFLYVN
jgi:mono/diheme cytochrome c family protein